MHFDARIIDLLFFFYLVKQSTNEQHMNEETSGQKNNPLHGKTLANILDFLVEKYGWEELGNLIRINCFNDNPSVQSSLKFLRKTEWARKKVEELYIDSQTRTR